MSDAEVDKIAYRLRTGMITYVWALHLVSRHIGATDAWAPYVVLSDAVRRALRTDLSSG